MAESVNYPYNIELPRCTYLYMAELNSFTDDQLSILACLLHTRKATVLGMSDGSTLSFGVTGTLGKLKSALMDRPHGTELFFETLEVCKTKGGVGITGIIGGNTSFSVVADTLHESDIELGFISAVSAE